MKKLLAESRSNLGLYIGAAVILILAEVGAVLAINLFRPDKDNTALTTTVTMLMIPTITSLVNLITGHKTSSKVEEASTKADEAQRVSLETGKAVNGRLEKLLEEAKLAAYLKGKAEGQKEGKDEAVRELQLLMMAPPGKTQPAQTDG